LIWKHINIIVIWNWLESKLKFKYEIIKKNIKKYKMPKILFFYLKCILYCATAVTGGDSELAHF
jgi:hypothetical protein